MRILFVSASPIRKDISIGNTFLNLFDSIEDIELASVFTRNGRPDPHLKSGFLITERMIVANLLKKKPVGVYVNSSPKERERKASGEQKKTLRFVKRYRWTIFFWIQDLVWKFGRWKSQELKNFIEEYDPDIIFTVLSSSVYLNHLILHISSISKAKLVLYAWDNNYSLRQFMLSPLRWIKHFIDRASMREVAKKSDLFYVISEVQKRDYERDFGKVCTVLTKGADFSDPPEIKEAHNSPLQLIFTGNIGLNRWKSLKIIADALEEINTEGLKAQLRIYTATPLTRKMSDALNRGDSSFVMGSVPASEIADIQKNADILVHVEALDLKNKLVVRQSFSTKIVDYLKAARPILAVGPKDVASIDHLIRNDCAIVADSKKELVYKLHEVLSDSEKLDSLARRGYECGKRHHSKQEIQRMLMHDLTAVCSKE